MEHVFTLPKGPGKRAEHWARRDVCRLSLGPVEWGKGSSNSALAQGNSKVYQPQENEKIAQLQDKDIAMVYIFSSIEGERALGARA